MYKAKTKFGVILFDDTNTPEGAWISQGTKETTKYISGTHELSRDCLWWSNLSAAVLSNVEGRSWIRCENFLGPKMRNILNEWGVGLEGGVFSYDNNQRIVGFLANIFIRTMSIATDLVYETRVFLKKKVNNELEWFQKNMLRGDFAELLPKAELPKNEMISIVRKDQAYVDYTTTNAAFNRGLVSLSTMIPRGTHARRMLETQIPVGDFNFVRSDTFAQTPVECIRKLVETDMPFLAEITIKSYNNASDESVFAFEKSMEKTVNTRRSWVTSPEFIGLTDIADVEVHSLYFAKKSTLYKDMIPTPMREFVENKLLSSFSWSAGVVAENIWRAGTVKTHSMFIGRKLNRGKGVEYPTASIREAWLKAADKVRTSEPAFHLNSSGYIVCGYGAGNVRVSCLSDNIPDMILDAVQAPLKKAVSIPMMLYIPRNFAFDFNPKWQGEACDNVLCTFILNRQSRVIRSFDDVCFKKADLRKTYLDMVKKKGVETLNASRLEYERSQY